MDEKVLYAAAQIEAAVRYARTKNEAYGLDETVLRDVKDYAAMLRNNAVALKEPK